MPLIQIAVQSKDGYPTAGFNPDQIVALYPYESNLIPDGTKIGLNVRDPQPGNIMSPNGQARWIISPTPVATILAALAAAPVASAAPIVAVERVSSGKPTTCYVNSKLIVAVQPKTAGTGVVWLTNGEELNVTAVGLRALAELLIAPPGGVVPTAI
jgi:hypothetical protein